jgi:hypothetical protein
MSRPAGTEKISRTRKLASAALAALLAVLALAAVRAPEAAAECGAPSISGTEQVGSTLTATAGTCTGFPPDVKLEWYRCTGTEPASCTTSVRPAQSSPSSYAPTAADAGLRLGVRQVATTAGLLTEHDWRLTGVITQPASPPPPPPPPTGTAAPLLSPFPIVTIAGRLTRRGARLTRLTVRAPSGSAVLVRCRGRSCGARSARVTVGPSGAVRLRRFQRRLRARTVLELVITKPGFVGKYTRFRIRRRRPPLRTDLCVQPGATTASACPA